MRVSELMTTDLRTASPDTTLEELATIMRDSDVGSIPIVDDEELIGIVTDRDIVVRCIAEGEDPSELTAEDVISESLVTVEPDADVNQAARLMSQRQIRRLPVVEGGQIVGILALGDIAVKGNEDTAGDALEDISEGVRNSRSARSGGRKEGRSSIGRDEGRQQGRPQAQTGGGQQSAKPQANAGQQRGSRQPEGKRQPGANQFGASQQQGRNQQQGGNQQQGRNQRQGRDQQQQSRDQQQSSRRPAAPIAAFGGRGRKGAAVGSPDTRFAPRGGDFNAPDEIGHVAQTGARGETRGYDLYDSADATGEFAGRFGVGASRDRQNQQQQGGRQAVSRDRDGSPVLRSVQGKQNQQNKGRGGETQNEERLSRQHRGDQGITSHDAGEEKRRNARVIPLRDDAANPSGRDALAKRAGRGQDRARSTNMDQQRQTGASRGGLKTASFSKGGRPKKAS